MTTLPRIETRPARAHLAERNSLEAFLRDEGYAEQTIRKTSEALPAICARAEQGLPLPKSLMAIARRIRHWLTSCSYAPANLSVRVVPWLQKQGVINEVAREVPKTHRATKLESFDAAGWVALASTLEEERREHPTETLVLKLAMTSHLRVGQILDTPLPSLRRLFKGRELEHAFDALRHRSARAGQKPENIGQTLATSPRAAYVRMHRYVASLRELTGLDFDFNTIYRTPKHVRRGAA